MVSTISTANPSFLRTQVAQMFSRALQDTAVTPQVATLVASDASTFRIPIVATDPAAGWVAEGSEITPSDGSLTEVAVVPKKLAGLTIVSGELISDMTPEAAKVVGDGLARDIAHKLDLAFFSNTTTNGPAGIKSITPTVVSAGGNWTDADPFTEAVYAVEGVGAAVDSWVANPVDALLLASIKETSTSNRGLLEPDATKVGRRVIGGVPLYTSTAVTVGEVWGIPKARVFLVVRSGISVETDKSVFFTSDRVAVRCTMRATFAFPHPLGIVKVTKA